MDRVKVRKKEELNIMLISEIENDILILPQITA